MKNMIRHSLLFLITATCCFTTARSSDDASAFTLSVDLGVNSISSDLDISATTVSSVIAASYRTSETFSIALDLGIAYCSSERSLNNAESSVVLGNPLLGAIVDIDLLADLRNERLGVFVGVPLATFPGNIPDNRHVEFTYNNANSMRGWSAPYLWLMNVVPLVVDARGTLAISEQWSADLTLMPAFLYSVSRNPSQLTWASTLGIAHHIDDFTPRLSWSMFTSTTSIENNNYDQHSLCLGTDIALGSTTAMIDVRMNLDAPNGVAVDAPKPTWGVMIGVRW